MFINLALISVMISTFFLAFDSVKRYETNILLTIESSKSNNTNTTVNPVLYKEVLSSPIKTEEIKQKMIKQVHVSPKAVEVESLEERMLRELKKMENN